MKTLVESRPNPKTGVNQLFVVTREEDRVLYERRLQKVQPKPPEKKENTARVKQEVLNRPKAVRLERLPTNDMRVQGLRVKAIRLGLPPNDRKGQIGMTQREFATAVGYSRSMLAAIEEGKRSLMPEVRQRLLDLYGVDAYTGEENK